ncbi:MAG TPA: SH3 domain-containing protein [Syntrophales bacterium]|nr:SH3 domain-containing protein [Syntrophales bacterium]
MGCRLPALPVLIAAVLSASAATGGDGTALRTGRVNADSVIVRASADSGAAIVGKVSAGQEVRILERKNGWYGIVYPLDGGCWVARQFVNLRGSPGSEPAGATVTGDNVRIRVSADRKSGVVAVRKKGDELAVVGVRGDWIGIAAPSEARAWISGRYVDVVERPEPAAVGGDGGAAETAAGLAPAAPPEGEKDALADIPAGEKRAALEAIYGDLPPRRRLAVAEEIYRSEVEKAQKGKPADLLVPGQIFVRAANDCFCDGDTRMRALQRIKEIFESGTPELQKRIEAFDREVMLIEIERAKTLSGRNREPVRGSHEVDKAPLLR